MTETSDEVLEVGELRLLPLVPLHLVLEQLDPRFDEHVVVTAVVEQSALVHADYVRADSVQKVLFPYISYFQFMRTFCYQLELIEFPSSSSFKSNKQRARLPVNEK